MKKPSQPLRVRIAYEPNRYSSDCLVQIYEKLGPVTTRVPTRELDKAELSEKAEQPADPVVATGEKS